MTTEMNMNLLSEAIAAVVSDHGELTVADTAVKVMEWIKKNRPAELEEWKAQLVDAHVKQSVRLWFGHQRATARRQATAENRLEKIMEAAERGTTVGMFATRHPVNDDGDWKTLAEMTGDDHRYVAKRYESRAVTEAVQAAFHREMARRVGSHTTAEVLSEEECTKLFGNVNKTMRSQFRRPEVA